MISQRSTLIENRSLAEQVYHLLKDRIIKRELTPGERIDVYRLAAELGVSRTPLKTALAMLEAEKLVTVLPRKGTFVSELSSSDLLELIEVRLSLESTAVKRAAKRISQVELQRLREIVHQDYELIDSLANPGSYPRYAQLISSHEEFHHIVVEAAGNRMMLEIYDSLHMVPQILRMTYPAPVETLLKSEDEHRLLIDALEQGDAEAAIRIIAKHLETVKRDVLRSGTAINEDSSDP